MIIALGIDAVEIERFATWSEKSYTSLARIFSAQEIDYCLSAPCKSAERFAARFAAKEALYKALYQAGHTALPFLSLCRSSRIHNLPHPIFMVLWENLGLEPYSIQVSITHTQTIAFATVILQKQSKVPFVDKP